MITQEALLLCFSAFLAVQGWHIVVTIKHANVLERLVVQLTNVIKQMEKQENAIEKLSDIKVLNGHNHKSK